MATGAPELSSRAEGSILTVRGPIDSNKLASVAIRTLRSFSHFIIYFMPLFCSEITLANFLMPEWPEYDPILAGRTKPPLFDRLYPHTFARICTRIWDWLAKNGLFCT